jgi:predicted outer membrane repeat protein
VDGSTFTSNTANGALNVRCNATISHSMFSANASSSSGGAVAFLGAATSLTLRANKFLNNRTTRDGGAVYWQPLVPGDRAMTVSYSTFTSNGAMTGGAIGVAKSGFSSGTSTINVGVSAFSHNTASVSGGAISATDSQLFVARATFADNSGAIHGGAVSLENSTHTTSVLANALLVRNSAEYGSAFFGANATFINSTVDSNLAIAAVPGAAILNSGAGAASHIKLSNSIVSNNASGGCKPTGLFDDGGRNLQFPKSDCGKSITVADPHLDSMYIPVPKSAPMGNGDLKVCMSAPINGRDVYGLGRPSGGVCTIGAAEGDINVLTHNRVHNRQGSGQQASDCGCDNSLVQKIERLLPFYP